MKRLTSIALATVFMSPMMQGEDSFRDTVLLTAGMAQDERARALAHEQELDIVNLTWEDTGRFKDSAVGPNISDMTIQVAAPLPDGDGNSIHCMPVIRFPNFGDRSADIHPGKFYLLVGNERGEALRRISLEEFLKNPTLYLSDPGSWRGEGMRSLHAPKRDDRVLVSAQACFLPVPKGGEATFNPVLFNYQSIKGDPAVLTVLATRQGTSVTVIDNTRDAFEEGGAWGQRLFFNKDGERASLTGQRASDFLETEADAATPRATRPESVAAGETGLNMVLLIQVPLKQRQPRTGGGIPAGAVPMVAEMMPLEESDVEDAVIGHGEVEGPFTEIDDLEIERDPRFPVRVTVQFYKATSNGLVGAEDVREIREQIDRVYAEADFVGSLVTDGDTGRVTEYDGPKVQPDDWWEEFWKRHEANTGDSRDEAIRKLRKLLGDDYRERPVDEGYLVDLLGSTGLPEGGEARRGKGFFQKLFGK